MHYYQHSIGDYRRDTMHLTLLEHGVYRQLLDLYYLSECELNANALRLICARDADEVKAAESVLNEFFDKTETGYKHKRCDDEIAKFRAKSAKAKASADARWSGNSDNEKSPDANAMRTHSDGNANHKPLTINHKPILNPKPSTPENPGEGDGFDEFWHLYPKKTGKAAALKAWQKIKYKPAVLVYIQRALSWQCAQEQWLKDGGQFVPNPATYLNQERWLDEPAVMTNGYRPQASGKKFDPVAFVNGESKQQAEGAGYVIIDQH